jgi:hypothetical protein
VGTKTITMYVSDLDQSEIAAGQAYQLSIRHPDGSTQQLDISEKNYRDMKLAGVGKTLKKRGRKPGSTLRRTAPHASAARARTANRPSRPDPCHAGARRGALGSQTDRAVGLVSMVEDLTEGGRCGIERSSRRSSPLRHLTSDVVAPIAVARRRAGNTATRISSSNRRCLGDNCQSSVLYVPVGSGQVRLGRHSVECGLVGCSRPWWNDRENDHQNKQWCHGWAAAVPGSTSSS